MSSKVQRFPPNVLLNLSQIFFLMRFGLFLFLFLFFCQFKKCFDVIFERCFINIFFLLFINILTKTPKTKDRK
jgi:hypothetical protein